MPSAGALATTSATPVFDGPRLPDGAHVNTVGSYNQQLCELDPAVLQRAGKVYADTRDAVVESGVFQQPLAAGAWDTSQVTGELGELLAGRAPGRSAAEEVTVFVSTGNAGSTS